MLRLAVAALALYVSLALVDGACESGYTASETSGSCVQLRNTPKTWDDARTDCQASGGDLVKILDESTNNLLKDLITQNEGFYWTGLRDHNDDGKFEWLDETTELQADSFTNWAKNQPNDKDKSGENSNGLNCVGIGLTRNSKWGDLNCDSQLSYICEKSA